MAHTPQREDFNTRLKYPSKNNVVFRSAKERPFAERKATNDGVILGRVPSGSTQITTDAFLKLGKL